MGMETNKPSFVIGVAHAQRPIGGPPKAQHFLCHLVFCILCFFVSYPYRVKRRLFECFCTFSSTYTTHPSPHAHPSLGPYSNSILSKHASIYIGTQDNLKKALAISAASCLNGDKLVLPS